LDFERAYKIKFAERRKLAPDQRDKNESRPASRLRKNVSGQKTMRQAQLVRGRTSSGELDGPILAIAGPAISTNIERLTILGGSNQFPVRLRSFADVLLRSKCSPNVRLVAERRLSGAENPSSQDGSNSRPVGAFEFRAIRVQGLTPPGY
jgi:hypothetical protein